MAHVRIFWRNARREHRRLRAAQITAWAMWFYLTDRKGW